jgi:hypothetical protein
VLIGALGTLYFSDDPPPPGRSAQRRARAVGDALARVLALRHRRDAPPRLRRADADDESERGHQTEFLLTRNGERALLGCKHGSAYKLRKQSVADFVGAMKFQGARSGLLVTPGSIDPDARKAAEEARVELIDGNALWPRSRRCCRRACRRRPQGCAANAQRRAVWISGPPRWSWPDASARSSACRMRRRRTTSRRSSSGRIKPAAELATRTPSHRPRSTPARAARHAR